MKFFICCSFSLLLITIFYSCQNNQVENTETIKKVVSNGPFCYFTNEKGERDSVPDPNQPFYSVVDFPSLDSVLIRGHWYSSNDTAVTILLCHQARWNKYEYDSIAVVLQQKGYNCLAIDQRCGGEMGAKKERVNVTMQNALAAERQVDYLDAEKDIIAAISYLYEKVSRPIVLWGSSYSSTLALYIGLESEKVGAIVAFSPGDYFAEDKGSLIPLIENSQKPFWITCSKKEEIETKGLFRNQNLSMNQIFFVPSNDGEHGSKALWSNVPGHKEYWDSLMDFLNPKSIN